MLDLIKRFVKEEEGATMVEYGLMVALIAVGLIAPLAVAASWPELRRLDARMHVRDAARARRLAERLG